MDHDRASRRVGLGGKVASTVFVGRDEALAVLDGALDRAWRFSAPQFVTVVAGAGMGKTHLLSAWLAAVRGPAVRTVEADSTESVVPAGPGQALAAVLRARFGLEPAWEAPAALAAFRLELTEVFGDRRVAEVAGLLGRWLGFDLPESPLSQSLEARPEQRADLARAVLGRFLERDAARGPMVWVLDDLERADDESLDVLENLAGELGEAPLVILMAARPELLVRRPTWGHGEGNHTRLGLPPLEPAAIDEVVHALLAEDASGSIAPALVARVAEDSQGNPRLVGELVRLYQLDGTMVPSEALADSALPATALIAEARVARLGAADRELLDRAACFGGIFWTTGLVALSRLGVEPPDAAAIFGPDASYADLRLRLQALARDGWVLPCATDLAQDEAWTFVSDEEREVLLGEQPPELVRLRTSFAAQWLEARPGAGRPELRDRRLEALGALYEAAGDKRRAAYCFLSAAEGHRLRLRPEATMTLLARALPLMALDDALAKMNALYDLGDLVARRGRLHDALAHFQEMLRLAWRLDLPAKGGVAHSRIGRLRSQLGEHRAALAHLEAAHRLFQTAGDRPGVAAALDDLGRLHLMAGDPEAALRRHGAALALRAELGDARGEALSLSRIAEVEHALGELHAALGHAREAGELRRKFGDRLGMIASWLEIGTLERDLGHEDDARAILWEGRRAALEAGEELSVARFELELGWLAFRRGFVTEAGPWFAGARERAGHFGAKVLLAEARVGLAEVALREGRAADAAEEARFAYELARRSGVPTLLASCLRVLALTGRAEDVELGGAREMLDRAVELLGQAGAELEMARALGAYADFEERQGRAERAEHLRWQAALIEERSIQRNAPRLPREAATASPVT